MSISSRGRLLFLHLLCVCYCFGVNFPVVISVRLRATALVCFGRPVYVWSVRLVDHFRKVGPVYCSFFRGASHLVHGPGQANFRVLCRKL